MEYPLNRHISSNIDKVAHLFPKKRPHKRGREPGMSSFTSMQGHLEDQCKVNGKIININWIWPEVKPTKQDIGLLMATLQEMSVNNFIYTFRGKDILQCRGGQIGARLTMYVSCLTMQDWWEELSSILDKSKIKLLMNALYVDDGRIVIEILTQNLRDSDFVKNGLQKIVSQGNQIVRELS